MNTVNVALVALAVTSCAARSVAGDARGAPKFNVTRLFSDNMVSVHVDCMLNVASTGDAVDRRCSTHAH